MGLVHYSKEITPSLLKSIKSNPKIIKDITYAEKTNIELILESKNKDISTSKKLLLEIKKFEDFDPGITNMFVEILKVREKLKNIHGYSESNIPVLTLHKYWKILEDLFTCKKDSFSALSKVILGTHDLDPLKTLGYFVVSYSSSEEVKTIFSELVNLPKTEIEERFYLVKSSIEQTYLLKYGEKEYFEKYVLYYVDKLKNYYKTAAQKGNAVLVYVI